MPAQIYQDILDCEVEVAEIVGEMAASDWPHYPLPPVRGTGQFTSQSVRTVVLENELIRATFAVDLGGRLLEVLDKRTATEVLAKVSRLAITDGALSAGVQFSADGRIRSTSMSPMHFATSGGDDEDEPVELSLFELIPGAGLSHQVKVSLAPEEACLRIETRLFNRTFQFQPVEIGFAFPESSSYSTARDAGFHVVVPDGELDFPYGRRQVLAPRQSTVLAVCLVVQSRLGGAPRGNEFLSLAVNSDNIAVQAAWPADDLRLTITNQNGEQFGTGLQFDQSLTMMIPLVGELTNPARVTISDSLGTELIAVTPAELETNQMVNVPVILPQPVPEGVAGWRRATRDPVLRGAAYTRLGQLSFGNGAHQEAAEFFEQALMFNGDDVLTWVLRAMCDRKLDAEEDSQALLNAHYLAPLEPMLRVEAFLAQPNSMSAEPHPLVGPLAEDPEAMVDAAVQLIEAGLLPEAGRWIDEACRHRDLVSLRILQADLLLTKSEMRVEVHQILAALEGKPVTPPYPWRAMEFAAIERLLAFRPESALLQALARKEF